MELEDYLNLTNYVEANAFLFACEPETEDRAARILREAVDLKYLDAGARALIRLILVEKGNRAMAAQKQQSGRT